MIDPARKNGSDQVGDQANYSTLRSLPPETNHPAQSTPSSAASNFSTSDHDFLAATAFRKRSTTATRCWLRDTSFSPGPVGVQNIEHHLLDHGGCRWLDPFDKPAILVSYSRVGQRCRHDERKLMRLVWRTTIVNPQRPALTK